MRPNLREALNSSWLTGDGAMGTYLYQLGFPVGVSYEEFNLHRPEVIERVHRHYYEAGARLLETNTFSANAEKLSKYGLEGEVASINRAGVRIARAVAGKEAYVAGAVGSVRAGQRKGIRTVDVERALREQLEALLSEGVDGIQLETFLDLTEMRLALKLVRELSDVPVICQFSAEDVGRTQDGTPLHEAFRLLQDEGADMVGLNCRSGPNGIMRALDAMEAPSQLPLSVFPNAGIPDYVDGIYTYSAGPDYFAEFALRFAARGARLIGGCCGTTPAHIAAIAAALRPLQQGQAAVQNGLASEAQAAHEQAGEAAEKLSNAVVVPSEAPQVSSEVAGMPSEAPQVSSEVAAAPAPDRAVEVLGKAAVDNAFKAAADAGLKGTSGVEVGSTGSDSAAPLPNLAELARQRHTVIVELDPPRDLDIRKFLAGAAALKAIGADAVTMADNSLAVTRMSNLALGALVQEQIGLRPLVHLACRDRNLIGTQSHMMGLDALGIDHVLAVTGDPARFGDLPGSSSVYDLTSFEMIRMIKQLNEGVAFSGKPLKQKAAFVVGAAFNPNVKYLDKAIQRLERKIASGADYIMTQPVYDPRLIEQLAVATRHLPVPVFIGIMPLASGRNAEYLHNEVPGIQLSDEVRRRMSGLEGEAGRAEGVQIATELLDAALPYFNGIYLITPFMFYEMTVQLTKYVWEKTAAVRQV